MKSSISIQLATLLLPLSLLTFGGCKKEEPEPPFVETCTFTVNGLTQDFSSNIAMEQNLFGDHLLRARKTDAGILSIFLEAGETGTFTESNYGFDENAFTVNYDLTYRDAADNLYSYYSSDISTYFTIKIDKFENRTDGKLTGTFSGMLRKSILADSSAIDSVIISGGVFATELSKKLE